jgi:hypothetical protein
VLAMTFVHYGDGYLLLFYPSSRPSS